MSILRRSSKGQVMVLYALGSAALIGALALCTDVAIAYVNQIQVQKAADAAALAGANYMSGLAYTGTVAAGCSGLADDAEKAACSYAAKNGLAVTGGGVTVSEPSSTEVKVFAQRLGLPYQFGQVLGLTTYDVSATAIARAAAPVNTINGGLFPIGFQCTKPCSTASLIAGEPLTFGAKFVSAIINANGNWQWLDVSGNGASGVGAAITGGQGGTYTVGGTIPTKPGNIGNAGPVKSAFDSRMKSCDKYGTDPCSGANPKDLITAGDPCLVTLPIVDFTGCGGKCDLTIQGFAEVYLEPTSTSKTIDGCFVNTVAAETVGNPGAPAFGAIQPPVLIQ